MKETYTEARDSLEDFLTDQKQNLARTDMFTDCEIHSHIDALEARCLEDLNKDLAPLIEGLEEEDREEVEDTVPFYENSWDIFEGLAREVVTDELNSADMDRTHASMMGEL